MIFRYFKRKRTQIRCHYIQYYYSYPLEAIITYIMPNKSLKELVESIKNWLSGPQPQPIPIPVHNDRRSGNPSIQDRFNRYGSILVIVLSLMAAPFGAIAASSVAHPYSNTIFGAATMTTPGTLAWLANATAYFPIDSSINQTDETHGTILFLGDSLTAGYGIEEEQAYPALIGAKIKEHNYSWNIVNAGLSGETSSGGLRRINWLLRSRVDILVLALGANDGLRGVNLDLTKSNLQAIIDRTREINPQVRIVIAGMQVPPNLGTDYTRQFEALFPELARANNALLIPFLLEDVAAIPELNLPDGIHPTPQGHQIMAATVWTYLEPLLR
jgi:acyl-CoA thioesterase I